MRVLSFAVAICVVLVGTVAQAADTPNPALDILVTFENDTAESTNTGASAPYQHRKRYTIARQVRRDARAVAKEYSLKEVDHWPIQSLSIYCFVYRVKAGADRESIIDLLNADARVESAQALQSFETSLNDEEAYDDTYANLQYGLDVLGIAAAHRTTRGAGVRIAIIDSHVDKHHEDLQGRIDSIRVFFSKEKLVDENHGTAVASVIGAHSNNALGIVGIAPEATLELYVSCWSGGASKSAVCDSFSLSKALDAMLKNPPDILNLSLTGPFDPLLERLIQKAYEAGVVVVAAGPTSTELLNGFPSSMQNVIGVGTALAEGLPDSVASNELFAPGNRILVAVPTDQYEFRSGSSLAAAHVSGAVALMLAIAPGQSSDTIRSILQRSQIVSAESLVSINAFAALELTESAQHRGN